MKNLEGHIQSSLENYEVQYDPADWTDMESRLNKVKGIKSSNTGSMIAVPIVIGMIAVAGGLIYYFSEGVRTDIHTHSENNTAGKTITTSQNAIHTPAAEKSVQTEPDTRHQKSEIRNKDINAGKEKTAVRAVSADENEKKIITEKTNMMVENNNNETNDSEQKKPEQLSSALVKASFRAEMDKICAGSAVQFTADNNDVPCTYKWYFGDGETAAEQNPKHVFKKAGNYTVRFRVTSLADKKSEEQKNTVTVLAAPSVEFNYSAPDDNKLVVNFEADADKASDWKWGFGDKKTSSEQNPSHTYAKYGTYKASLTARNSSGCSSSVAKEITVKNEINLLAPSGFSPNGDGINDTWMPVALQNGDYDFTLTIYDQANAVVYTTSDKNRSWEGQNTKTGDKFIWKAVVNEKNGMESTYKGFIIISDSK